MNIKKTALALGSALMLFATTLNAQEQPWSFGVKGGGSMSWLMGFDKLLPEKVAKEVKFTHEASGSFFVTGGLTAGYAFHENVGVGIELLYARLGGVLETSKKLPGSASDAEKKANKPSTLHLRSNNLVVPVMLKWFPMGCDPEEGIITVDLGVQGVMPLSVAFDEKKPGKDKFETLKDNDDKEVDKSKNVQPFTVDAIAGVSYEFPEIGLTLEGRYHLGLMDFFKDSAEAKTYRKDKLSFEEGKNVKNSYATVSLGYNFAGLLMD